MSKEIINHPDGFLIIKPKDHDECPAFCPVCQFPMTSFDDVMNYEENKCCEDCTNKWVFANRERWNEGWRPPQNEIDDHKKIKRIKTVNLEGIF